VITDGLTGETNKTVWRYEGERLIALEHSDQNESYEYDQRGFKIAKLVRIKTPKGEFRAVTRYTHDDRGLLMSASLPDGSKLNYQRDSDGQVIAITRQRIQTPWLQNLESTQTIVRDLERDFVGIKRFVSGNGIQTQYQRSAEGVLARILIRRPGTQGESTAPMLKGHVLPGALGLAKDPQALIEHRYLWDARGNLIFTKDVEGDTSYAYDSQDRLIHAQQSNENTQSRYFYKDGRRVLSQEHGDSAPTQKTAYSAKDHRWLGNQYSHASYDDNGQPRMSGDAQYRWDALGRLVEISQSASNLSDAPKALKVSTSMSTTLKSDAAKQSVIANYRYNHRGERIAKIAGGVTTYFLYEHGRVSAELNERGELSRQYIYLGDRPLAVIDTASIRALKFQTITDSWWLRLNRVFDDFGVVSERLGLNLSGRASSESIAWIHHNHLGAPELATNQNALEIWRAEYSPFGRVRAESIGSKFTLNLRFPGQYEDAETGLHYNRHRYYDPSRGEYLTPDPLGTPDGPNGYAYVRYNPLKYIDPQGLILFAFDGTDNTDDPQFLTNNASSASNVVKFRDAYLDGKARYVTGVGTDHRDNRYPDIISAKFDQGAIPDRGGNYSGPSRIIRMWNYFDDEAEDFDDKKVMDVDIVGFSRGAAQARDFANKLTRSTKSGVYEYFRSVGGQPIMRKQCVNFRFMGLFDTVLSENRSNLEYQLDIPSEFSYVAHAVALNEYRSKVSDGSPGLNIEFWGATRSPLKNDNHFGAFPLESISSSATPAGKTRVELGFVGAHADIGGGYAANDSQLSLVALNWMVGQAKLAKVTMNSVDAIDMNNPVIHDQSNVIRWGNPNGAARQRIAPRRSIVPEDRTVNRACNPKVSGGDCRSGLVTQRALQFTGNGLKSQSQSMVNADTHGLIDYTFRPVFTGIATTENMPEIVALKNKTGTVKMKEYMAWLCNHGYAFGGTFDCVR
jgi:RHS repeat-associated protein